MTSYETVTNKIIAMLEAGTAPWSKSWASGGPMGRPLRATGEGYQGINTLILWGAAQDHGYQSRYWLTYKAAQAAGGQVRKGEKATTVFFFTTVAKAATETEDAKMFPLMKSYCVFNADQCDGLAAPYLAPTAPPEPMPIGERHAGAEAFAMATRAVIRHGGARAYFRPSEDIVQMPGFADFNTPEAYYAVLLHELTHWSGHKSRLDRSLKGRFGDPDYAFEELIAELGAAYLCADLGVSIEPRPDHASYIAGWIKGLRDDPRAIFRAAAAAEKAATYLHAATEPMAEAA